MYKLLIVIIPYGLLQYGLGFYVGYRYKRYPQPIQYETDGTRLTAIFANGGKEKLKPIPKPNKDNK